MIKFFRHIRRSLINENKMGKYFKYAIGEILLVMIGILLALQVNNWNENRKSKLVEKSLLNNLVNDLSDTRDEIVTTLQNCENNIKRFQYLEEVVLKDLEYTPKLDTIFGGLPYWDSPYLTQTAFTKIKDLGVDIISNTEIRNKIIQLHEKDYQILINDWDRWEWDINQSVIMPYFSKHFRGNLRNRRIARPNNFEALKQSDEFLNVVGVLYRTRIYGVEVMNNLLTKIDDLLVDIKTELN